MKTQSDLSNERQLNPLAFPVETHLRYVMMILVAAVSLWTLGFFGSDLLGSNLSSISRLEAAAQVFNQLLNRVPDSLDTKQEIEAFTQEFTPLMKKMTSESLLALVFPAGLTLLAFLLALIIYRSHPIWMRHRKKLRRIAREDDPEFWDTIQKIVHSSGITPVPSIYLEESSIYADAQAFGFRGFSSLQLHKHMRLLMRKKPEVFKTIILHELGHIENQDLHRTYFTQAIWVVVTVCMVLYIILHGSITLPGHIQTMAFEGIGNYNWNRFITFSLPLILIPVFQLSISLIFIAAIRSSILRVRELYADWRAIQWGERDSLIGLLKQHPKNKVKRLMKLNIWNLHPTMDERLLDAENSINLFEISMELALFGGFLFAYIIESGTLIIPHLFIVSLGITSTIYLEILQFLIDGPLFLAFPIFVLMTLVWIFGLVVSALSYIFCLAYMITGTVGLEVQREAVSDLVVNRNRITDYLRLWKPAIFTTLGVELGFVATLGYPLVVIDVGRIFAFFSLTWLWLIYIRFVSLRLFGTYIHASSPRLRQLLCTASLVMLSWILYLPIFDYTILPSLYVSNSLALGGSVFLFAAMFVATWIGAQAHRLFVKRRCISCKKPTYHYYAVGQFCENCGEELAPWIYASTSSKIA